MSGHFKVTLGTAGQPTWWGRHARLTFPAEAGSVGSRIAPPSAPCFACPGGPREPWRGTPVGTLLGQCERVTGVNCDQR